MPMTKALWYMSIPAYLVAIIIGANNMPINVATVFLFVVVSCIYFPFTHWVIYKKL
jgi:hypothetical protein